MVSRVACCHDETSLSRPLLDAERDLSWVTQSSLNVVQEAGGYPMLPQERFAEAIEFRVSKTLENVGAYNGGAGISRCFWQG